MADRAWVHLPPPGSMIGLSQPMTPTTLQGLKVNVKEPFRFQFLVAPGDATDVKLGESERLVRYFLAALATPESEMWVNLSPIEHDRILETRFGQTQLGRDLLGLDYVLKQVASTLMYPQGETGKVFWKKVYEKAQTVFGTSDIPTDVFNKVWVVSSRARIYENEGAVYITDDTLDVMLDSDHKLAQARGQIAESNPAQKLLQQMIREEILPAIRKEVNEGEQFASLRQIHRALILAAWYKKRFRSSFLARAFVDQSKIAGVTHGDPAVVENIYNRYVDAFNHGVFNYVREDQDIYSGDIIPRKYFAGGMNIAVRLESDQAESVRMPRHGLWVKTFDAAPIGPGIAGFAGQSVFKEQILKPVGRVVERLVFLTAVSAFLGILGVNRVILDGHADEFATSAMHAVQGLQHPNTKLFPSHINSPGLENIAFSYDLPVLAGVSNLSDEKRYAEIIMDFFMNGLSNSNLVKAFNGQPGFMNAVDIRTGNAGLEYLVTPGPNAWIGLSALNVDKNKYLGLAVSMGKLLLLMQRADGGIIDGDRDPNIVNTEPHMDAVALFYRLYGVTGEQRWKIAADKGKVFFYNKLYNRSKGLIVRSDLAPEGELATDTYSWPLLGVFGDEISKEEFKTLIDNLLNSVLVRVEAPIPGGEIRNTILVDYTDPRAPFAVSQRGSVHPLGTVEWTGGVVSAVQKAAIRFSSSGDSKQAGFYKALAEELLVNAKSNFGRLSDGNIMAFYATEPDIPVAFGWKSPGPAAVYQGSPIGHWILFPMVHFNPFTGVSYDSEYNRIKADDYRQQARVFMNTAVQGKQYSVRRESLVDSTVSEPVLLSHKKSQDLLAGRTPWQASGSNWKASFLDLDMSRGVSVVPGEKIKISLTVDGTIAVVVALLVDNEMPDSTPNNLKDVSVEGNTVEVTFVIPQDVRRVKRILVAHGELAWGKKVGSQSSTVTFEKVELLPDNAEVGGIDFTNIDFITDTMGGALSFEMNDSVVSAFQERLFGLEPILISSQPVQDIGLFLGMP